MPAILTVSNDKRGRTDITPRTAHRQENYEIAPLPDDAMREIRDHITTNVRFNSVVTTGVPGFIPSVPTSDAR